MEIDVPVKQVPDSEAKVLKEIYREFKNHLFIRYSIRSSLAP